MTPFDDNHGAEDRKYRAPALEKGLDVLEMLSANGDAMTPSQLSVALGRSVSELFRMIQVLEFRGFIEQGPGGYRLTNRLFTLGMNQAPIPSLVEIALPEMRALADQTRQSCHLVVESGEQIVVIARIEGPGDIGYSVRIGYCRNLIDATSGLMLYGCATERSQRLLLDRLIGTHGKHKSIAFAKAATAAAKAGHAVRASDFVKGVTDLVAPIMGADGIIATLITPFIEFTPPSCPMPDAVVLLKATATRISGRMGLTSQA